MIPLGLALARSVAGAYGSSVRSSCGLSGQEAAPTDVVAGTQELRARL